MPTIHVRAVPPKLNAVIDYLARHPALCGSVLAELARLRRSSSRRRRAARSMWRARWQEAARRSR